MTIDAEQTSGLIVIGGLVVVLAMQIRHGVWLREIARHDGVLFRFCEIRRSVVRLLFDRHLDGELSRRDYVDARRLLDVLNHVIGDYDKRKAVMFNFRRFVRALRKYEKTAGELRLPRAAARRANCRILSANGHCGFARLFGIYAIDSFRVVVAVFQAFFARAMAAGVADRRRSFSPRRRAFGCADFDLESANFGDGLIR